MGMGWLVLPDSTAAPTLRNNLITACQTLWGSEAVHVSNGHPGPVQIDDIVAVMGVTSEQEPAAYGPRRPREETLTVTVMFSIYRAGGAEMEKVASDRGYELLGELEKQLRVTDTTVGGAVRECFLTSHQSEGSTDPQVIASGRLYEIEAVFTAKARVTS